MRKESLLPTKKELFVVATIVITALGVGAGFLLAFGLCFKAHCGTAEELSYTLLPSLFVLWLSWLAKRKLLATDNSKLRPWSAIKILVLSGLSGILLYALGTVIFD